MGRPIGLPKTGGRGPGVKNRLPSKLRLDLIETLRAHNYDPIFELIRISQEAWKEYERASEIFDAIQEKRADYKLIPLSESDATTFLNIAAGCAKDIAQYVYPRRKAVELAAPGGENLFQSFTDLVREIAEEGKDNAK